MPRCSIRVLRLLFVYAPAAEVLATTGKQKPLSEAASLEVATAAAGGTATATAAAATSAAKVATIAEPSLQAVGLKDEAARDGSRSGSPRRRERPAYDRQAVGDARRAVLPKKTHRRFTGRRPRVNQHISSLATVSRGVPKAGGPKDESTNMIRLAKRAEERVRVDYGAASGHRVYTWFLSVNPLGTGTLLQKVIFLILFFVQFFGPYVIQRAVFHLFNVEQWRSPLAVKFREKVRTPLRVCLILLCSNFVIVGITAGLTKDTPLLEDVHDIFALISALLGAHIIMMGFYLIDKMLKEQVQNRVSSADFHRRREFLSTLKYGQGVVAPCDPHDDQGQHLYSVLWRPFFLATCCFVYTIAFSVGTGDGLNGFPMVLALAYFVYTFMLAIFGARTLGPQIYGGIYIYCAAPFQEGDIISLEGRGSGGGAQTIITKGIVTGFVEQIGVCSTVVRRFDMRCVFVPNNMFIEGAVSNWATRPRKLIYLDVSASHRTPPEVCDAFQAKMLYMVKNHKDVDQSQYIKVAIRSLKSGVNFVIICFTAPGVSKKVAQQDMLIRIMKMARLMGIGITFDQKSMYVEREEVPCGELYVGAPAPPKGGEIFDVEHVLPELKTWDPTKPACSPKGQLVVEVGELRMHTVAGTAKPLFAIGARARFKVAKGQTRDEQLWTPEVKLRKLRDGEPWEAEVSEKLVFAMDRHPPTRKLPKHLLVEVISTGLVVGSVCVSLQEQIEKDEMEDFELCDREGSKVGVVQLNVFAPRDMVEFDEEVDKNFTLDD